MIYTANPIVGRSQAMLELTGVKGRVFDGDEFRGRPEGAGFWGYGKRLVQCEDIVIRNCTFHELNVGLVLSRCKRVVVEGCDFTKIQTDAIKLLGCEAVEIRENSFTDFRPNKPIDHADAVQAQRGHGDCNGVLIEGNLVWSAVPIQGFFLSDPTLLGHAGVVARDNLLIAMEPNVIVVDGSVQGVAEGNTVLVPEGWKYAPQIRGVAGQNFIRIATAAEIEAARLAWLKRFRAPPVVKPTLDEIRAAWAKVGQMLDSFAA